MVVFPNSLTEEEEALQKKYAKLKKKVWWIVIYSIVKVLLCFNAFVDR